MKIFRRQVRSNRRKQRGQSMVEMALAFPILLLIMSGTLEIGMYYNDYLSLIDATRESARFLADQAYWNTYPNPTDCSSNQTDFFVQGGCGVINNLFGVKFDPAIDDIVISAVTVQNNTITIRYPLTTDSESFHAVGGSSENGWSYCRNVAPLLTPSVTCTPAASLFNNQTLQARITSYTANAPDTGLVIVEIYHVHHQFLGLIPPGLPFLPADVMIHAYTIMPLPSAAPSSG